MSLPRVFVIGDSISLHFGPYLEEYLKGRWSYARNSGPAGSLDVPEGANGGDSDRVLEYVRSLNGRIAADSILLNCGLHDIKRELLSGTIQVPLERYQVNLATILKELKGSANVAWIRTTPVHEPTHNAVPRRKEFDRLLSDVRVYNEAADCIMKEHEVPTIDLHGFTAAFMPDGTYDGVHFNETVRQLQAAYIAGALDAFGQTAKRVRA